MSTSVKAAEATLDAISGIKATRGKSKIAALQSLGDDSVWGRDFKQFVGMVYDPMVTFGVTGATFATYMSTYNGKSNWGMPTSSKLSDITDALDPLAARERTGSAALRHLAEHVDSWEVDQQIQVETIIKLALDKDLDCGIGIETINKAFQDLIRTFEPMKAHKFEPKRVKKWPVRVEPKFDGLRLLVLADTAANSVQFLSRSGKTFSTLDHLKPHITALAKLIIESLDLSDKRIMFDGEVISGIFNETTSAVRKKNVAATDAIFHVFDFIVASDFETKQASIAYEDRRALLDRFADDIHLLPAVSLVESYLANSVDECLHYYQAFRDRGLEGAIVKPLEGVYEFKRSYYWLKLKAEDSLDLPVIDAYEGEGKYVGMLGGIIVDHKGVAVRVGGGFSDAQRVQLWEDFHNGELAGRLAEVEFHEVTPDGSLRHPRFKRFRSGLDGIKF